MSTTLVFRDPYVLDFLDLRDSYKEKDLESAIIAELERFIMEMGRDFTFVGRQVRLTFQEVELHGKVWSLLDTFVFVKCCRIKQYYK